MRNGVANRDGTVYTEEKNLVISRQGVDEFLEERLLKRYPALLPQVYRVRGQLAAMSTSEFNYFHWMYEVLPKIHLLDKAHCERGQVYVNISTALQWEMLELLGISAGDVINANDYRFVEAEQLLVPYLIGLTGTCEVVGKSCGGTGQDIVLGNIHECVGVAAWICEFLRDAFLELTPSANPTSPRIYISRSDAVKGRKVENEEGFVDQLREHGFETLSLTGMRFSEQVEAFRNAEVIIAPHGAGLTNLTFCRPGATCIELFGPSYVSDLFASLSQLVGVRYFYLVGKGSGIWESSRSNRDMEFDRLELEDVLQLAEIQ